MSKAGSTTDLRSEEELQAFTVGKIERLRNGIEVVPYDPTWPELFRFEEQCIRNALGDQVILLEHVGSTSVPGLAAKPKIDMVLAVPDSSDEDAYVPPLQATGYLLRIREPEWNEHRVLIGPDYPANLHVFTAGCDEIDEMLMFRDWLRANDDDRDLYQRAKLDLASRDWEFLQHYADAKTTVVQEIKDRARAAGRQP